MRYDLLLICIFGWGLAVFLMKVAGSALSPAGVVLTNTLGYLLCLPFVLSMLAEHDRTPRTAHLVGMLVGVLFVTANFAFYRLLSTGQVARLAPLTALNVAVPVLLGFLILRERLTPQQWLGAGLAVVALYLLAVEPRERQRPAVPHPPQPPVLGPEVHEPPREGESGEQVVPQAAGTGSEEEP